MAEDHINVIERAIIDKLRADHSGVRVYGQFPEANDAEYPCIVVEITSTGEFERLWVRNLILVELVKLVKWLV